MYVWCEFNLVSDFNLLASYACMHTYVSTYVHQNVWSVYICVRVRTTHIHMYMHCYACIHTCMCMHRHTHSQIHIPHRHNALKIMYTSFNTILHHFQLSIYISNDFMLQRVLKIVHTYIHTCIHTYVSVVHTICRDVHMSVCWTVSSCYNFAGAIFNMLSVGSSHLLCS